MKNRTRTLLIFFALSFTAAFTCAQMVSPSIDKPGEPFSYFSAPTDEIGILDSEAATEITPEGFLRTGFAELMFFTGPENEPISARVRTLEDGCLPVMSWTVNRDGLAFHFTAFGSTLTGKPGVPLVNYVQVRISNTGSVPARAILAAGVRYDGPNNTGSGHGQNRFDRPREPRRPGGYRQLGEAYSANWKYSFAPDGFFRDSRLLYAFPAGYESRGWTMHGNYNYPQDVSEPRTVPVEPTVPAGIVTYSRMLKPGESYTLDFTMPVVPTSDAAEIAAMQKSGFDAAHDAIVSFWRQILAEGMQLKLPEKKPVDAFYANLIYDLIARDKVGDDYIQTVNKLHYHEFYLRDSADIVRSYDLTGYPTIAKQDLDFFAKSQREDGNFLSQDQQYDGWGEAVWGYSQHYRMTHDKAFAEWALPQIARAVDWLKQARAADPLHIMPKSDVRDNEFVPGHLTGYNFLALSGLKLAIAMAHETGHDDLAGQWQQEHDDYRTAFLKVLDQQAAAHDGYIPPALDGQGVGSSATSEKNGYDWGNMLAVVYEPVLDPMDPRVATTLKRTQARYQEGIMTYANGEFLHHYLTIKNTLTELVRDTPEDQAQAIRELYALLMHTSSTHAGFEFAILPWGDRNFQDNLAPHGWFSAELRTLMRNMMVREAGDQLHLLSALSPEWIGQGKTISATQIPTYFGKVGVTLTQPSASEARLKIDSAFDHAPASTVLHVPWFLTVQSATADGKPMRVENGTLTLPATAHEVVLHWNAKGATPQLSYQHTVDDYKAEYARRYNKLMHGETPK